MTLPYLFVLFAALVLAGSWTLADQPAPSVEHLNDQDDGLQSIPTLETLKAFSKAWNDHDVAALMSMMSDDEERVTFHAVAGPDLMGTSYFGRKSIQAGFESTFKNFPDAQWLDAEHFLAMGGGSGSEVRGISESTFVGTKTVEKVGLDGQALLERMTFRARMVDVFTFDAHGKILVKNAFRKDRRPVKLI